MELREWLLERPSLLNAPLQAWLPPELWAETTLLLVGFGQEICAPKVRLFNSRTGN